MASATLTLAAFFPQGTVVEAHPRNHWSNPVGAPEGAPAGAATATDTVTTEGKATFVGLVDDGTVYRVWAPVLARMGPRFMARDIDPLTDPDAPAPDGYVKAGNGDGVSPSYQNLLAKIEAAGYGAADLLVSAPLNNLFSANGVPGATNRLHVNRVITPKAGKIVSFYACLSAVGATGTFEGAILDVNGSRRWTQGPIAATSMVVGWNKIGDPNIDVDAAEPLFLSWLNPENTIGMYRYPVGNVLGTDLPHDLIPEGNGKVWAHLPGQTSIPAFADPNSYVGNTLAWAVVAVVI